MSTPLPVSGDPDRTISVRRGHQLTTDPTRGESAYADMSVKHGRIKDMAVTIEALHAELIDATDQFALPGFVDAHRYMWPPQVRAQTSNSTLIECLADIRQALSASHEARPMYIGILMRHLDALNAGRPTSINHCRSMHTSEHAGQTVQAFVDSGVDGIFCYRLLPNPHGMREESLHEFLTPATHLSANARNSKWLSRTLRELLWVTHRCSGLQWIAQHGIASTPKLKLTRT
ncbi:hypothetical protein PQQ63_27920 [Paraburkholderia metrosideri]|uniref:Uncharacterized protein n=1 Tax=Paraburkholderia metrosideri TaxID=580937 RepID=A0ABW9E2Z4_9BURK